MAGLTNWKAVLVVWEDAHSAVQQWTDPQTIEDEPAIIHSVGFILEGLKAGHVSIAQSLDEEGMVDSVLCVPSAMVIRIVPIADAEKEGQGD